ncbi:MAG: hypothetical protein P9L99_18100 [Candidatus Lernaella stagnicola]|nr:hypothetical protein [Candidatus Lernaella stagnicola]
MKKQRTIQPWIWLAGLLVIAVFTMVSCTCGPRQQKKQPVRPNPNAKQVARPGGGNGLLPKDMTAEQRETCRKVCKSMCHRGKECKIKGFTKAARCNKGCFLLCAHNVIDESITSCMKPDTECSEVEKCLGDLKQRLQKIRDNRKKTGTGKDGGAFIGKKKPAAAETD